MKPRIAPRHIAAGVALVGLGWLLNSASQPFQRNAQNSSCRSNLKRIGLAIFQYERDYDESFPLAHNWADSLSSYSLAINNSDREAGFQQRFRCPTSGAYYAFNEIYAGKSAGKIDGEALNEAPLVFDVSWGKRNFSDDGSLWPTDPPIHGTEKYGGNNVAFADGHVKLMTVKPKFRSFATPTPKSTKIKPARPAKP